MTVRDYVEWHRWYDDPSSGMSWRLDRVRHHVAAALDERPGPVRIVSSCAGDGRDVLGVLSERADAVRVKVCLVEIDPQLAKGAETAAAALPDTTVEVRRADAGLAATFRGAVPADVVLLVGIFGNVSEADLWTTIAAAPQLCGQDAVLLWSRGRNRGDLNDEVRQRFSAAGFVELAYETNDSASAPALGVVRYEGAPVPLRDARWFRFVR